MPDPVIASGFFIPKPLKWEYMKNQKGMSGQTKDQMKNFKSF